MRSLYAEVDPGDTIEVVLRSGYRVSGIVTDIDRAISPVLHNGKSIYTGEYRVYDEIEIRVFGGLESKVLISEIACWSRVASPFDCA